MSRLAGPIDLASAHLALSLREAYDLDRNSGHRPCDGIEDTPAVRHAVGIAMNTVEAEI